MFMWDLTIDDYINICEISKSLKIKPGESMKVVIIEYMKAKGIKAKVTDLTKEELIEKLTGDGKNILEIEHDEEDGEQTMRIIKKDEDTPKSD